MRTGGEIMEDIIKKTPPSALPCGRWGRVRIRLSEEDPAIGIYGPTDAEIVATISREHEGKMLMGASETMSNVMLSRTRSHGGKLAPTPNTNPGNRWVIFTQINLDWKQDNLALVLNKKRNPVTNSCQLISQKSGGNAARNNLNDEGSHFCFRLKP